MGNGMRKKKISLKLMFNLSPSSPQSPESSSSPLPITNYQLPITNYQLPITNYPIYNLPLKTFSAGPVI
ncbi:MAG: hypothetical protein KME64_26465 [Scytonematopsis contorta HA4267-MV1]|nr:hypothetical protein [Scytonematopsis contorta HA4267-MV1]